VDGAPSNSLASVRATAVCGNGVGHFGLARLGESRRRESLTGSDNGRKVSDASCVSLKCVAVETAFDCFFVFLSCFFELFFWLMLN
jgi:hypothetical protein